MNLLIVRLLMLTLFSSNRIKPCRNLSNMCRSFSNRNRQDLIQQMGVIDKIKNSEYLLINIIFAVLILFIFFYSLIFAGSGAYPIKSSCVDINNPVCISKGLSRAFSQIMLGDFEKAKKLNPYRLLVFIFLFTQIIIRIILSVFYGIFGKKMIIRIDIVLSFLLFIYYVKSFFLIFFNTIF